VDTLNSHFNTELGVSSFCVTTACFFNYSWRTCRGWVFLPLDQCGRSSSLISVWTGEDLLSWLIYQHSTKKSFSSTSNP